MASTSLPDHKLIPQTGFIVDGFKYRNPVIKAYFLSHAHGDHYTGLRENWDYGPIYCSAVTGKLVVRIVGVSAELIRPLEWDTPTVIEGVEVTLIDANHCPGAAQLLFKLSSGETYIHCGDMRFGAHLLENPHLQRFQGCNAVYLDTTYCNPKYTFPPQEEAVEYIAATISRLQNCNDGKRRLFLIQTYVIGKEHILIEVFKRCQKRIFLSEKKMGFMECLDMPGLVPHDMFTTNPDETNIHLTQWGWLGESWPFFRPNFKNMETTRTMMGVDEVIGFCPTGWMYEMKKKAYPIKSKRMNSIHLVPYSEHSSYLELRDYVRFLKPHKVIPTVGVDGENADRNKRAMLKHFRNLVNETASKATFLAAFKRSSSGKEAFTEPSEPSNASDDAGMELASDLEDDSREPSGNAGLDDDEEEIELPKAVMRTGVAIKKQPSEKEEIPSPMLETKAPPVKAEAKAEFETEAEAPAMKQEAGHLLPKAEVPDAAQFVAQEVKNTKEELKEEAESVEMQAEPSVKSESQIELSLKPWTVAAPSPGLKLDSEVAGSSRKEDPCKQQVEQLIAVLGTEVQYATALKLLHHSKGDLQRAINAHYDSGDGRFNGNGKPARVPAKAQASPLARAPKRKRGGSKALLTVAKQSVLSPEQRRITSFFGQGQAKMVKGDMALERKTVQLDSDPEISSDDTHDVGITAEEGQSQQSHIDLSPVMETHAAGAAAENKRKKIVLPPAPRQSPQSKKQKLASPVAPPFPAPQDRLEEPPALQEDVKPEIKQDVKSEHGVPRVKPSTAATDRSAEVPWDAVLKSVKEFKPVAHAIWEGGRPAPYLHVGRALAAMDSTTKRLRISDVIANMFRCLLALSPDDILPAAYLVTGKLAPDYEGVEMNVGGSIISGAVIEATGVTRQRLSAMYKELGDLGDVAQACRHNQATLQKPAPLTVRGVFKTMKQIASEKGNGSALRKQRAVLGLLRSAREEEPKYIVRTLISNLRVGANWRSVIPGLARAFVLHEKGGNASKAEMDAASAKVSEAFHLCPNLGVLIPALREGGLAELERRCTLKAGVPLKPMLAKICEGIPDALRQLKGDFLAEFKYDGQRSQIHLLPDGSVKLFSRNCEDKTVAFPDVVETVQLAARGGARELVMDTELVAVDRADENRLKAFQELSTRARGMTEMHQVSVQVCVFVFDILMVDGEAFIKHSLRERRARISKALPNMRPGFIQLAQSIQLQSSVPESKDAIVKVEIAEEGEGNGIEAQLQTYLLESFASGTEGLMLKALDTNATYQASKRSESWIKLKRDYCEGLRDSLDLVPIGAWWGQGRKTGWFSPFLLAAWDPEKEEYQSVCRCMSGFTDTFYTEATKRLGGMRCERKSYYNTGESCSVWFEPNEVWEIRGADLTISPVHKAAIGCIDANLDRGVSLRFPRYICTRVDKGVEDASSPEVIVDLYNKQTRKMSSAKEMLEAQKRKDNLEEATNEEEAKSEAASFDENDHEYSDS